ncbi:MULTISPECIES: hypothetical protein [unclassified Mesorhizobium]|uniref:hypothetical protein n=1 Tax=unclassified Mesorhizobium TaxID=325217 RepID=UPI0024180C2A|nr:MULTISPECIES: hypothetical protein [unclassified Mesorhizobium]WFP65304.1 hypothetical protein QAZ47_12555 [Mesorhizobium sp. WSM4904]WFP78568.1 hypothetical protein QAZ22_12495 [Mesorhizobium sp. WSM4906]
MTITGKLCRNPFSTIKLAQEDGGSKAGGPTRPLSPRFPGVNAPFLPSAAADLLMRGRALCIQKALEKSVIRVAARKSVARP